MAQQVKVLAAMTDDLISIPISDMMEEEEDYCKSASNTYTYTMANKSKCSIIFRENLLPTKYTCDQPNTPVTFFLLSSLP